MSLCFAAAAIGAAVGFGGALFTFASIAQRRKLEQQAKLQHVFAENVPPTEPAPVVKEEKVQEELEEEKMQDEEKQPEETATSEAAPDPVL